jgi:hypothetical protein
VAGSQIISQVISTGNQASKLVLIPRNTVEHATSVASALYRPPII